jgi:hypothetical protein
MDKELQRYYEERFSMMVTTGWADLMDDLQVMLDRYSNIDFVNTDDTLQFRKGQVDILKYILGLKELSERSYRELQDDSQNI